MKGGYKIIDFRGVNLTESAKTIPGIYESIEGNYHKPLLLSGIVLSGVEKADVFAASETSAGNYVFSVYGGTLTVTAENAVTYTKNA